MKFKIFINIFILGVFSSTCAMAGDPTIIQGTNPDGTWEEIFFTLVILALALLALWLFKNSRLLSANITTQEPNAKEWLNTHIKDLEGSELDKLINRGNVQRQKDEGNLLNHKN